MQANGTPTPGPGSVCKGVHRNFQTWLAKYMDERLRQQLAEQLPETASVLQALEAAAAGKSFTLDYWWMQPGRAGGKSLGQLFEETTLGGAINRPTHLERARRDFVSSKATAMLSRPRGEAHTPVSREMKQSELPNPAPPRLTSEAETEGYIKEMVKMFNHEMVELVTGPRSRHRHELVLSTMLVYKPGSPKPRFCVNAKPSKGPVVDHVDKRHCGTGSTQLGDMASPQDLAVSFDLPSGYRQCLQTRASADRELTLIEEHLLVETFRRREVPLPTNLRVYWWRNKRCHLIRPRTVSFGNPRAVDHFKERMSLPVSQMRQHGMRLALQVDDSCVMCRYGPAETLICGAICLVVMAYYGYLVHVTGDKKPGWPSGLVEFDGTLNCFALMTRYSPPAKDDRHRECLLSLLSRYDDGSPVSMQELLSVVMQQQSHRSSHWPTAQLMPRLRAHVSNEQKRLRELCADSDFWDLPTRPFNDEARSDAVTLTLQRLAGEAIAPTGPTTAVMTCDASCFAAGVQYQRLDRKGRVVRSERHKFTLTEEERTRPHTVQENLAVANAVLMTIRAFDLRAEHNQYQFMSARSDNQATVSAGNKPSSTLSMSEDWRAPQWEARSRGLMLRMFWLKKLLMDRTFCDYDGRKLSHGQVWGLLHSIFLSAMRLLQVRWNWESDWDLAACRVTTQARRFYSRFDEPETEGIDTLTQPWNVPGVRYLYLPESVIGKALQRLEREPQQLVMVVPLRRKTPSWWPTFQRLCGRFAIIPASAGSHYPPEGWNPQGESIGERGRHPPFPLIMGIIYDQPYGVDWLSPLTPTTWFGKCYVTTPTEMGTVDLEGLGLDSLYLPDLQLVARSHLGMASY